MGTATSDALGVVRFDELPPGRLLLRTRGEEVSELRFVEIESAKARDLGEWRLDGRVLRSTLRGPGGKPSAGFVDVTLASWGANSPRLHYSVKDDGGVRDRSAGRGLLPAGARIGRGALRA